MEVVVPYQFVVAQIWTSVCATRVQRFAVDRGLLAVAPLYDGFLPIEYITDKRAVLVMSPSGMSMR